MLQLLAHISPLSVVATSAPRLTVEIDDALLPAVAVKCCCRLAIGSLMMLHHILQ